MDPLRRDERIDRIIPCTGSIADAYWHHLVMEEPAQILKIRTRQRMYLARYARQDVHSWDDREISELQEYFLALSDMVGEENELNRAREDR